MRRTILLLAALLLGSALPGQAQTAAPLRERTLLDEGWRFALGNADDEEKDHQHAMAYFSYMAKAGHCDGEKDGPMCPAFDDRGWRLLDLPHDWAVELPFDPKAGYSHGYKALGRDYPQNSVGWYRKRIRIPGEDLGKRISLEFDGVFRDSVVWVNGFYMGREQSGYDNFRYDISDYLNYGGENTIVVRVDATLEEGWFYEGAGIYRHVWLTKTGPLHVAYDGVFVSSKSGKDQAEVSVSTEVKNGTLEGKAEVQVEQTVLDAQGRSVAEGRSKSMVLTAGDSRSVPVEMKVSRPHLWDLGDPYLYRLVTVVRSQGKALDKVETPFGIRDILFDADKGFFLNGKSVKIKGLCVHQDHAGVGVALPDALQDFRIKRLLSIGCNAYRCSHNPPTPELLDACDRLGMLVLTENRLMGTAAEIEDRLERQVRRQRNHPCVIAWSLGNEEWKLEWSDQGSRIAQAMQAFVKRLDPTRRVTAAVSGWGQGVSKVLEMMGFNYLDHGDIDAYHKQYPGRPCWGTEDSTTNQTRGTYDRAVTGRMGPKVMGDGQMGGERSWKFYMDRPYLAGVFLWTGFDYRGEESPFVYPAISSQYGVLDTCGFPKDCARYLQSWWKEEPALFLAPHWDGKAGQKIKVWAYSNCGEVELFLNGKSLGKKDMPRYSHLEWEIPFEPGVLSAKGYKDGSVVAEASQETTGNPARLKLTADRAHLLSDGRDVSVLTVEALDAKGRRVPTAMNEVHFELTGPGRILGVGNGDPICHEADRFVEEVSQVRIEGLKMKDGAEKSEMAVPVDDSRWKPLFTGRAGDEGRPSSETPKERVVRGAFTLPRLKDYSEIVLYAKGLVDGQSLYINGQLVDRGMGRDEGSREIPLPRKLLRQGLNHYAVAGKELLRRKQWEVLNQDPGYLRTVIPAAPWKRSLFNGLAQVILQSSKEPGAVVLKASSQGLKGDAMTIETTKDPDGDRP